MFDVQPVDRLEFKRHQRLDMIEADMAYEPQDPDAAADRLEAALERIARLAAERAAETRDAAARAAETHAAQRSEIQVARAALIEAVSHTPQPDSALSIPEIAERLDSLIGRLRAALGVSVPGMPPSAPPEQT